MARLVFCYGKGEETLTIEKLIEKGLLLNSIVINKFISTNQISVSEAMQKIDSNAYGILFLTENNGRLDSCITDGDVRRFLLKGGKLSDFAHKASNKHPKSATSEEEAKQLYHRKNYIVIPIVDNKKRIVSLYFGEGDEFKRKKELKIPIVINAGGKGTRLDPFTKVLPKPLIPIGELPIIELILKEYQSYACNEFHIIVNYKKELLKTYFADDSSNYNITWYDESEPLGTGGGLTLLRGKIKETFFFANCDVLLKADYDKILQFHREKGNVITMICAYRNLSIPYGVVEIGDDGMIKNMKEKPTMTFLTNTGIYIVEPEVIDDMSDNVAIGFPDVIEMQRRKGKKVAVYPVSENDWMDMGQLPELEKMRLKLYGE